MNDLISRQPETHEERTETHACDCISRQDAIDAHYEYCNKHPDASFPVWSLKILKDLPSAQPERQKGEWIDYTEDGYVECPFCHSATNCDGNKDELHFCFFHGFGKGQKTDIESMAKIIEHVYDIAFAVGGEKFSNIDIPAYVKRIGEMEERRTNGTEQS